MQAKEALRQAYLNAMGIQPWFPREVLPHAQPARSFDWEVVNNKDSIGDENQEKTTAVILEAPESLHLIRTKQPQISDILKRIDSSESTENNTATQQLPSKKIMPTRSNQITQFRLVIIPLGVDHLVVAEMPYIGLNQFTRYHHRLLTDFSRAFHLPPPSTELIREFVWPLVSATKHHGLFSKILQDEQAATDAINAFLTKQFNLPQKQVVLLFGQAASHLVFDSSHSFDELKGIHLHPDIQKIYAITYGLNELMKIPPLKEEAWHDLQPLLSNE